MRPMVETALTLATAEATIPFATTPSTGAMPTMTIEDSIAGFRTRAEDFSNRISALRRSL